jgi:hypothetical protein
MKVAKEIRCSLTRSYVASARELSKLIFMNHSLILSFENDEDGYFHEAQQ